MSVFFNGERLTTPTVASVVSDDLLFPQSLSAGNRVALVGRSEGGQPLSAIALRSPSHARSVLRSGEGLDAVRRAFAPSADTRGPSEVMFVRINPAVQSALTLEDAGAADAIALLSTDYGQYTNRIKIKVEDGTNTGKRVSVQLDDDYYTRDDIARQALTVEYTGGEASATITVEAEQVQLHAPAASLVASIDLNTFRTVQELADRINAETGWSATITPGSARTPALTGLDALNAADATVGGGVAVRADLQAIIDWINSPAEGFITAVRAAGAGAPPANIDWTYLTGGTDGIVTNDQWQSALDVLQGEDVQWLAPLSDSAAIWAMFDAHAEFMSGPGKAERRVFVGAGTGLTVQQASDNAALLNSDRTAYCFPGIQDFDANGDLQTLPAYMLAAQLAGAFAGLNPGATMTNKSLRIAGAELTLHNPTETDALINSGVLAVYRHSRGGIRVAKAVSTWLNDGRFNRVEISTGAAVDFVMRSVREVLESFVGRKAGPISRAQAISTTDSVLRQLAEPEPTGPGVLVGTSTNPAFRNIRAEIDADVLRVEFEILPVIPINYVLVSVYAAAFRSGS